MAGYKMKTHKGAAKRFRITGKGKVKRGMGFAQPPFDYQVRQQDAPSNRGRILQRDRYEDD